MYLLFDIGGTYTRLATSIDGINLGEISTISTSKVFPEAIAAIKAAASKLTDSTPLKAAIGGVRALDGTKTKLLNQPHFPLWVNESLKDSLEKVLNTKVYLENDAALAGLGEAVYGAGKEYSIVTYLTVSTGVGGIRIMNGKIDKSALGFEPGNQIINLQGETLESYISGEALRRKYEKDPQDIDDPQIWEEVARILALGLNNLTVFWSPQVIILGGSVMNKIPVDRVKIHLRSFLKIFPNPPEIKPAQLNDSRGLYGALAYLNQLKHI